MVPLHLFLSPIRPGPFSIVSLAILGVLALLAFISIGRGPKASLVATAAPQVINQNAQGIALSEGEVDDPQVPVTATKTDRLSSPLVSPQPPSPSTAEVTAPKPAEAFDYAQAEAEKVRRAHAEVPDLCQRHGMKKVWTQDGKSWRCRR